MNAADRSICFDSDDADDWYYGHDREPEVGMPTISAVTKVAHSGMIRISGTGTDGRWCERRYIGWTEREARALFLADRS